MPATTCRTVLQVVACVAVFLAANVKRTEAKNGGRLFALSFMNLTKLGTPTSVFEEISISSFMETTLVSISIPQIQFSEVFSLDSSNRWTYSKNIAEDISVPLNLDPASSMAIIIASKDGNISVHANKAIPNSGAGYLALALRTRTTSPTYDHYVPGCNNTGRPFLSVVSVYNDTCLSVDKYDDDGGLSRRIHFRTMQANEVFNMYSDNTDYTGFLVRTRKPVAVYGGCDCIDIPDNTNHCDHIMEQIPYVLQLGFATKFVMASIPGRPFNVGFTFRIIAAPPSVSLIYNVTVYSYNTATAALETTTELADGARLARGSYIEHTVGRGNDKFTVVHISCNTFCEVLQYNPSLEVVTPVATNQPSDPAMVLVPSTEKYAVDITFPTSSVNVDGSVTAARNYLTFVSKDASKDTLTLDGTLISALAGFRQWISVPALTDIHVALFDNTGYKVSDGFHTLTATGTPTGSETEYNAFVYGHGPQTAYGYLAGYDQSLTPQTIHPYGPWYDITLTGQEVSTTVADVTTTEAPDLVTADDLPTYSMLFVANFTALSYGPQGKTPDFSCSNNYGKQFIWRVGQLNERLSALTLRQQDVRNCASSNIDIIVGSKDLRYFSEYSHSGGEFWVNVTGNGTATLSDINTCALELAAYVRNPDNWISDYHFTKFLRNDDVQFNRVNNLEGCAEQYISSTDHQLTLYVRGWVCPLSTGAVVGAAPPHVLASLTTVSFVVALSYVVQLIITIRPR